MIALKRQKLGNHTITKFLSLIDFLKSRGGRMTTYPPYPFKTEALSVFNKYCSRFVSFLTGLTCVNMI